MAELDLDIDVDLDTLGRKDLQTLAKKFGIKANQKNVVLRSMIREAVGVSKENHGTDGPPAEEKLTNTRNEAEIMCTTNNENGQSANPIECGSSVETDALDSAASHNQEARPMGGNDEGTDFNDYAAAKGDGSIMGVAEKERDSKVKNKIPDCQECTNMTEEKEEICIHDESVLKVFTTNKNDAKNDDRDPSTDGNNKNDVDGGKDNHLEKETEQGEQKKIVKRKCQANPDDARVSSTKIPRWTKQISTTKDFTKTTENRVQLSTKKREKEVPLWKLHSKDFIRNRGANKTRDIEPKKSVKRVPFRDCSNNNPGRISAKSTDEKVTKNKVAPKPLPMSKRNEEQMKKFVERQMAGRGDRAKKEQIKVHVNPMSKRNEEQMKKFVERQLAGREDRAKKEQIKAYVHTARD